MESVNRNDGASVAWPWLGDSFCFFCWRRALVLFSLALQAPSPSPPSHLDPDPHLLSPGCQAQPVALKGLLHIPGSVGGTSEGVTSTLLFQTRPRAPSPGSFPPTTHPAEHKRSICLLVLGPALFLRTTVLITQRSSLLNLSCFSNSYRQLNLQDSAIHNC